MLLILLQFSQAGFSLLYKLLIQNDFFYVIYPNGSHQINLKSDLIFILTLSLPLLSYGVFLAASIHFTDAQSTIIQNYP